MKKIPLLVFAVALVGFSIWRLVFFKPAQALQLIQGTTMGTIVYNVKYLGEEKVAKEEIDQLLISFNKSLSTYDPNSEISVLNLTGNLSFQSEFFYPVLTESKRVFNATKGAFDPTVGPLINAWGFGPDKNRDGLDTVTVDSLLNNIGYDKVLFSDSSVSIPYDFKLDFSAVAKGYAVDLVGELLESKKIDNYMVEIGGELRCRGINNKNESWSIAIEDPTVAPFDQEILAIIRVKDLSLATSGNYRNYYFKNGKTFAHIIDPRSGYTSTHNLLSASVFAKNCITADAFATALMVLGLEESIKLMENEKDLEGVLIYQSDEGVKSYVSDGISQFITYNQAK